MPRTRVLLSLTLTAAIACGGADADLVRGDTDATAGDRGSTSFGGSIDGSIDGSGDGSIDGGTSIDSDGHGSSGDVDASATAGTTGPDDALAQVRVDPGETQDAERIETLEVAREQAEATRRVVLRLGPEALPDLREGDRLIAAAEVQVTTRCDVGQGAPGCDYNPRVAAQLVLTGDDVTLDPEGPTSRALSPAQQLSCTRAEHHCMFVFRPHDTRPVLEGPLSLPCVASGSCRVVLVMWAWNPAARAGGVDRVLIGENEGDYLVNGEVGGDKARLMVVRERAVEDGDRHGGETTADGTRTIPTDAEPVLIYSHRLADGVVRRGEQFVVEAQFVTRTSGRARVSSKMFVTTAPDDVEGQGLDVIAPRQIGEHNGINCTADGSPCTSRKVAVFRVTEDVVTPLYVNVAVRSAVPGGGNVDVEVRLDEGWLRSTGYAAVLEG